MKKVYVIVIHILAIITVSLNIYQYSNHQAKPIINSTKNNNNNLLSMMVENNQGEYEESDKNEWPDEGYIFDSTKSKCENGGQINYQNSKVQVTASGSDRCYVYFALDTMANKCELGYADANSAVCTILKTYGKDQNLYYHDGNSIDSNSDLEAGDNSYRYSGSDYEIVDRNKYQNVEDIINVIFNDNSDRWYNTFKLSYKSNDETADIKKIVNEAISDGYLKETKINNFVCIPSTIDNTCSNDNLYRIIGVFPNAEGNYEVKLIKYEYILIDQISTTYLYYDESPYAFETYRGTMTKEKIGMYPWHLTNRGSFSTSDLKNNKLDNEYINKIDSSKIANHLWITPMHPNNYTNAKTLYTDEFGGNKTKVGAEICGKDGILTACLKEDLEAEGQIGLITFGEYMYAFKPNYWQIDNGNLPYYILSNWVYMGLTEPTLTEYNLLNYTALVTIHQTGRTGGVFTDYPLPIRPSFYLKSDVCFISGDGSYLNPYKLA